MLRQASNPHVRTSFQHRVVQTFLNQSNNLDPETTLYIVFFGIK